MKQPIDCNEGVLLLRKRMDSHPEEFEDPAEPCGPNDRSRWYFIVDALVEVMEQNQNPRLPQNKRLLSMLTDTEVQYLWDGLKTAQRKAFTSEIKRRLLTNDEDTNNRL